MEHAFEPGAPNQPAVRMPSDAAPPPASTLMSRALTDEELVQLGITRPLRPELVADLNEGLTLEEIAERHGRPLLEVAQKLVWWWPRMVLNLDVDVLDRAKAMLKAARGIPGIQAAPPNGSVGWFRNKDSESDEERPESSGDAALATDTEADMGEDGQDGAEEADDDVDVDQRLLSGSYRSTTAAAPPPVPATAETTTDELRQEAGEMPRQTGVGAVLTREYLQENLKTHSVDEIAVEVKCSPSTVEYYIRKRGVKNPRPTGQKKAAQQSAATAAPEPQRREQAPTPQAPEPTPDPAGMGLRIRVARFGESSAIVQRDLRAILGLLEQADRPYNLQLTLEEAV